MTKLNTLRARLVLWTMFVNAVLLMMLSGLGWIGLRQTQNAEVNNTLQLSAAQLIAAVDVIDSKFIVPASDAGALTERGVFGWVIDGSGKINSTLGRVADFNLPEVRGDALIEVVSSQNERARLLRRDLPEGNGSIVVGISLQPLEQISRRTLLGLSIVTPVVLALSALGGLFLAGRALSPIAKITAQAKRISRDNLSERLSLAGPRDEVRELAQTFDEMLDRLQSAFETERRFTGDASHELRTPLSLLKAQITLAVSRSRDAQSLTSMIQAMEGDVDRMTRLVETMLTLARSETPLNQHIDINVAELLGSLVGQLQNTPATNHITFVLDAPPELDTTVVGDPDRLIQLFTNLLDNAVKYSPEGGNINVRVRVQDGELLIEIEDMGRGIALEHLPHVFERFYRVDSSRARQTGGFGLGLPITLAIAKQHGGHVSVSSMLGTGSVFTVWLPKASR